MTKFKGDVQAYKVSVWRVVLRVLISLDGYVLTCL